MKFIKLIIATILLLLNGNDSKLYTSYICTHELSVIRRGRFDQFNLAFVNIDFHNNSYQMVNNNNYDILVSLPGYYPTDNTVHDNTIPLSFNDMISLRCGQFESSKTKLLNLTWPDRSKPIATGLIALNDIANNFPHNLLSLSNFVPSLSNNKITAILLLSASSCKKQTKNLSCDYNIDLMTNKLNDCVFYIKKSKDRKLKFMKPPYTFYDKPIYIESVYNNCNKLFKVPSSSSSSSFINKKKKHSADGESSMPIKFSKLDYANDYASAMYDLEQSNDIDDDLINDPSTMKKPISALEIKMRGVLDAPIKDVVLSIAKSVAQPATKIMSKPILDTVDTRLGQMTTSSMSDQLVQKLAAQITEFLSQSMPRQMATSLAAALRDSIPPALDMRVSPDVVPDVRQRIKIETSQDMARHIPPMVEEGTAEKTALYSLKPVAHILSRSLTHIIPPSLTHVMRHAPAMDFICDACFKHSVFCQYCHVEPVQVMYSIWYAGYYSTYYSSYYGDYYYNYYRDFMLPLPEEPHMKKGREVTQTWDKIGSVTDWKEDYQWVRSYETPFENVHPMENFKKAADGLDFTF